MKGGERPIVNPFVVLREEFDDWAVLFDSDTGHGFGLNPTGVYLWKLLDGEHSIDNLLKALRRDAKDVPLEAGEDLDAFVAELTTQGLTAYEAEQVHDHGGSIPTWPTSVPDLEPADERETLNGPASPERFVYAKPCLVCLSSVQTAEGRCQNGQHDATGPCRTGSGVLAGNCHSGYSAPATCNTVGYLAGTCSPTGSGT